MTQWTDDQLKAITGKTNILVNAAAGSGKTAVLTERIARKLLPDENGEYIGIDNLLVVTFARDAAHEMQERIKKALTDRLAAEKNKETAAILKQQIKKLPFADITTIDAFCMRLVKNNFHLLGIDPKFIIMETAEAKIFTYECIDEYFSKLYDDRNADFLMLTSLYATNYSDDELRETVYKMYRFTRSLANPNEWLRSHCGDYKSFSESSEYSMLLGAVHSQSAYCEKALKALLSEFSAYVGSSDPAELEAFGKSNIYSVLTRDIKTAALLKDADWNTIYNAADFQSLTKSGFGSAKDADTAFQKQCIDKRNEMLSYLKAAKSNFNDKKENIDAFYEKELFPQATALAELVCGFSEYFFNKKSASAKFEFNDLEHMAIELLNEFDGIRESLKSKYKEILMDEYQDTNDLQEAIFSMLSNGSNRFIVGDMKQSIYRFRQSDPLIFLEKDMLYKSDPSAGTRIVLSKNFRSRQNVLDSINYVFEQIMTRGAGEIDYDNDQALYYGNHSFDSGSNSSYASELYILEGAPSSADDETLSDIEREADFTARKIREMIDGGFMILTKDGTERKADENDFAILLGAVRAASDIYINALMRYGLSANVEDSGFFEKTEIRLLLEFIKAVNNPLRDIPLLSVMRSPVYRFTDEELASIRLYKKGNFYGAVKAASGGSGRLAEKCGLFIADLEKWRSMSLYMTADRLIWRILSDSSLYDMCSILYGGDAARANMRLLMERARALSENGIATLFDFERYITRLVGSDSVPCAKRSAGGVTIMTIHKSKGLEFPVVLVCSMGKKFVSDTSGDKIYMHKTYGFGINAFEKGGNISIVSHHKEFIGQIKKNEAISEQLRKLYVAFTRAKEKLIVIGTAPNSKNKDTFAFTENEINDDYILSCGKFLDMIAPAVKHCENKDLWLYKEVPYSLSETAAEAPEAAEDIPVTDELTEAVFKILDKYDSTERPPTVLSKVSVSALKNNSGFSVKLRRAPQIITEKEIMGAAYGTLVHSVMEKISFKNASDKEYVLNECGESNEIASKISGFFQSSIGRRAAAAQEVKKEAQFEISIPAISEDGTAADGETMLLQGIIDCYFEEADGIVLIDYKTDVCSSLSELEEKYYVQLKWYKYAIENILKKNVKEVYIYSFHKNKELKINIED